MDATRIRCRNTFINSRLVEGVYKCFAHVFDAGDDQLVRDRFLSLRYTGCTLFFLTTVVVPCTAIAVSGYFYELQWLYAVAISIFILPLIWRFIYRWYILSASNSFVYSAKNFDNCINSVITAIREREVISFGVLVNSSGEFHCCNRALRIELLNSIRGFVRKYTESSEQLAQGNEKEKLLRRFFTDAMTQLALSNETTERLIYLSSLKELIKLLSLVRSEYIRLTLFRFTEVGGYGGLKVIYALRKFKKMQNKSRKRFNSALKYVFLEEDEDVSKTEPKKSRSPASTVERAVVELGLAIQILKKSESEENKKKVNTILHEVLEMMKSEKAGKLEENEDRQEEEEKAVVETPFEKKFRREKVYEGVSDRSEEPESPKIAFYTKLQKRTPMTRALVNELKGVLGNRRRSSTSSNETDVGLKIVLDRSSDDSNVSSSLQDSSLLSSTTSSDEIILPIAPMDSKLEPEISAPSYGSLHPGILEAIRPRSQLPATTYGDSDED